jgi:hypothetical protein
LAFFENKEKEVVDEKEGYVPPMIYKFLKKQDNFIVPFG